MTAVPLGEAKNRLSELTDRVHREHDRVHITVHGQPRAVLISEDDLESLEETLAILSDPQTMADLAEAEAAISRGELYSAEQVAAEVRARRQR